MMNEMQEQRGRVDEDPFYILASAPSADERSRVLKCGDTFAVFDHFGDIQPIGLREQGIYHEGTRFLSCFVLRLGRGRPLFLSSTVKEDNDLFIVDLTNPDIATADGVAVPRGIVHLFRTKFLWQGACFERVRIKNYGMAPVALSLGFHFEADYRDIFEVRGTRRTRRGVLLEHDINDSSVVLAYRGLDDVVRRTRLSFLPSPQTLSRSEANFHFQLQPAEEKLLEVTISCEVERGGPTMTFDEAVAAAACALQSTHAESCTIHSSKQHFNDWINRTVADVHMMVTQMGSGPYPYAGVPWFSTPFGRDGILTALECLWLDPALARGVLAFLAATQAREVIPEQDAEPGKILHETRRGEMAALGEIPFGRYYGSVDATPLFVLLAGAYYERTADRAFVESIWPHVEAALSWIDTYGDVDGDGFVEYERRSATGLENQGWKDSHDAVFHSDGQLAQGPIALCEVQAYVYGAKRSAANLAHALGMKQRAQELHQQGRALRAHFEKSFWCEELGAYGLALDGAKRLCRVRTSNSGHCLLTGIASEDRARRVARTLLAPESFSGWGVRTVATGEARYNPMSYHNGSVWPHDNALIACGLARYGCKDDVLKIMSGLYDASLYMDLHRLPELFCGFERRPGEGPTLYPVACSPQAWAAASVFFVLQASLGLYINAPEGRITVSYPMLPQFLKEVRVQNLRVGQATIDLLFLRHEFDVGINVLRREGKLEVSMLK
jgi:glycogen debranching enzyme